MCPPSTGTWCFPPVSAQRGRQATLSHCTWLSSEGAAVLSSVTDSSETDLMLSVMDGDLSLMFMQYRNEKTKQLRNRFKLSKTQQDDLQTTSSVSKRTWLVSELYSTADGCSDSGGSLLCFRVQAVRETSAAAIQPPLHLPPLWLHLCLLLLLWWKSPCSPRRTSWISLPK